MQWMSQEDARVSDNGRWQIIDAEEGVLLIPMNQAETVQPRMQFTNEGQAQQYAELQEKRNHHAEDHRRLSKELLCALVTFNGIPRAEDGLGRVNERMQSMVDRAEALASQFFRV